MSIEHVILLIIDDFRYDSFVSLTDNGTLPNLQKMRNNAIWGKSITTFPSVTIPAHLTIMTGAYQDSYKVPLIHYYDRINRKINNYSVGLQAFEIYKNIGNVDTIFERIDGPTCNVFEPIHRGTSYNYPGKLNAIGKYLYYKYISDLNKSNDVVVRRILKVFKNPGKYIPSNNRSAPIFTAGWFPATDMIMHNFGASSNEYINSLKSVDRAIGKLLSGLEKLGYLKRTVIILVSDHGNYSAKELYNPQTDLAQKNLFPLYPKKNKGDYDIADGSVLGFYFAGDGDTSPKTESALRNYKNGIDTIEAVKQLKGIKWIAFRDDECSNNKGTITFMKKVNEDWKLAHFHYYNRKVRYEVEEIDLLGYDKAADSNDWLDYGKFYSLNEWLEYTHDLDFPIFPDQICRNFINSNSCDLYASSMAEIVYNSVHGQVKNNYHVHAHDVALARSMQVPILIYNLEFISKKIKYSKTSDISSTIFNILNLQTPSDYEGNSLLDNFS
ncbi:MAG: alkaline phosphatase family protein [Candidatus Helarchaeota archaeon]